MKNIHANLSGFFRALKRNTFKNRHPIVYKRCDSLAFYWFCTQKVVWSYTVIDQLEERIVDERLKKMCNIVFEDIGEVR